MKSIIEDTKRIIKGYRPKNRSLQPIYEVSKDIYTFMKEQQWTIILSVALFLVGTARAKYSNSIEMFGGLIGIFLILFITKRIIIFLISTIIKAVKFAYRTDRKI